MNYWTVWYPKLLDHPLNQWSSEAACSVTILQDFLYPTNSGKKIKYKTIQIQLSLHFVLGEMGYRHVDFNSLAPSTFFPVLEDVGETERSWIFAGNMAHICSF